MNESITIECPHCKSQVCYKHKIAVNKYSYFCFICGFTTNDYMKENSKFYEEQMSTLPEIYKVLKYKDPLTNLIWIPSYKNLDKGMIYIEGIDKSNVKWVGVKKISIPENLQHNYPDPSKPGKFYNSKVDPSTKQEFDLFNFVGAYNYITLT